MLRIVETVSQEDWLTGNNIQSGNLRNRPRLEIVLCFSQSLPRGATSWVRGVGERRHVRSSKSRHSTTHGPLKYFLGTSCLPSLFLPLTSPILSSILAAQSREQSSRLVACSTLPSSKTRRFHKIPHAQNHCLLRMSSFPSHVHVDDHMSLLSTSAEAKTRPLWAISRAAPEDAHLDQTTQGRRP